MGKGYSKLCRNLPSRCWEIERFYEEEMTQAANSHFPWRRYKTKHLRKEETEPPTNSDIPDDVLMDILTRLPVKSLSRFKCVCKQWWFLIQGRSFTYRHLALASEKGMGIIRLLDCKSRCFRFYSIDDDGVANELRFLTDSSNLPISSCNGLLCFIDSFNDVRLCNPVSGKAMTLPKPACFHKGMTVNGLMMGLGFDSYSKKYKVVGCTDHYAPEVEVFTLTGENSTWRSIKFTRKFSMRFQKPIYVDGYMHWVANDKCIIIRLNLMDEKFSLVMGPEVDCIDNFWLCEIGGYLCMVGVKETVEVWVFRDEERQEWVKEREFCLPFDPSMPEGLLTVRNNKLLFESEEDECDYVCHYDEQGILIKVIKVTGLPSSSLKNYIGYNVESLLCFWHI